MTAAELWDRFLSVFFPPRCVLCDAVVEWEDLWCGRCPLERYERADVLEGPGLTLPLASGFLYKGNLREAIISMKRRPQPRALRFFAGETAGRMAALWPEQAFDVIVPVPISERKRRERGFNHAGLLAEELGRVLGLPVAESALVQLDTAQLQHHLNLEERRKNAATAFLPGDAGRVLGKRVLLVDNLCVSGATLLTCAGHLLGTGARSVHVAVTARAQNPVAKRADLVYHGNKP